MPSPTGTEIDTDEFGNPILQSPYETYEDEFASLAPGECSYSRAGDFDWDYPQHRQCKDASGAEVPPPPGALLLPVSLAVDTVDVGGGNLQHRVYVADGLNNRVQVFNFDGTVFPLAHPMGSGKFGRGPYSYGPGGDSGELLSLPYGISVDGAHRILVADGGNARVAVFNADGSMAFDFDIPDGIAGPMKPNQVKLTPGAVALAPGSPVPPSAANDRILVTDWSHCQVHVFDTAFNLINSLPHALPQISQHDACLQGDPDSIIPPGSVSPFTGPGEFSTVTGAAIDASGHIYVADHAQDLIQVFDRDLNPLGWIGRPQVPGPSALDGPVGIAIDHLGRIGVTDSGHARVAFYTVTYPGGVPSAQFEFQLDTTVAVSDFTMGMADQQGTLPGLDEKGRFLVTDPIGRRILRFELPDMGIVNPAAALGIGTFDVAVPMQKLSPVTGVTVTVQAVEPGVSVGTPTPTAPSTIGPGQLVSYSFTYDQGSSPTATFIINASGNGGAVNADPAEAMARATCGNCGATHAVYEDPEAPGGPVAISPIVAPVGSWYGQDVFVRITPTGSEPVSEIFWNFEGEAAFFYGGSATESPLDANGNVDVHVRVTGVSALNYHVVTDAGSLGPTVHVPLNLDLNPPEVSFNVWPVHGPDQGAEWYNTDVSVGYFVIDGESGSPADTEANSEISDGWVTFTEEGRHQSDSFTVADYVGHTQDANSATSRGGRYVNIDKTAPVIVAPNNIHILATGQAYGVIPAGTFDASATDPLLLDGSAGSGVVSIGQPGTLQFPMGSSDFTFAARDAAGNLSTVVRTVTVDKASSTVAYTGATAVGYAYDVLLSATTSPTWATGTVTFTAGSFTVTGPVVNGVASATIPGTTLLPGTSTVNFSYSGDTALLASTGSATITIGQPVPVTIQANPQTRPYGNENPPLDVTVTGASAGSVSYQISTIAVPASPVGSYPIHVTPGSDPLLDVSGVDSTLTVTPRPATITAVGTSKTFGDGDPAFGVTSAGLVAGEVFTTAATRVTGESAGTYAITPSISGATLDNYSVTPVNGTFTINKATVTVTARPASMAYGDSLPVLTFDYGTFPAGFGTGDVDVPPTCSVSDPLTAGPHAITCGLGWDHDVSFTYVAGTLTIAPATLTVKADNKSKAQGQANPALTSSFTGFVNGDSASAVTGAAALSTTATTASPAGTYPITATIGTLAAANYTFTFVDGTLTVTSSGRPTLGLVKTVNKTTAAIGDTLVYTLTYSNTGPGGATNVVITDAVPANTTFQSATGGGTVSAGKVVWTMPALAAGASASVTLTVRVNLGVDVCQSGSSPHRHGDRDDDDNDHDNRREGHYDGDGCSHDGNCVSAITNSGTIRSTEVTTPKASNTVTTTLGRPALPVLKLAKSVNKSSAVAGDTLVYTLVYANHGLGAATGVVLSDSLPSYTSFVSASGGGSLSAGKVTWNVAALAPGTSATVTMTVRVTTNLPMCRAGAKDSGRRDDDDRDRGRDREDHDRRRNGHYDGDGCSRDSCATAVTNVATIKSTQITTPKSSNTVTTAVRAANRPPIAMDDSVSTTKNDAKTFAVLGNDSDPDGNTLTVQNVTQPSKGSVTMGAKNTIKYIPPPSFTGTTSFTYTVSDGNGGSDTATVTISVTKS
ncbi:MAG: MBG domain-containing protein [Vicinamibacterales bacterium]